MRVRAKIDRQGMIWIGYPEDPKGQMLGFNPAITADIIVVILADRFGRDMRNTPFWIEVDEKSSSPPKPSPDKDPGV